MIATRMLAPDQLDMGIESLRRGGLVVFPTDTVYGVAALARDAKAVAGIFQAKQRPPQLPIPVMVASPEQLSEIARPGADFYRLAAAFWPGPLTIILPKTDALPPIVTAGGDTVALRIPDHPLALRLLQRVGEPLAVTSANLSGQPPARTAQEARAQLDGRVDAIIDGGPAPGGEPSTIVDLTQSPPKILRHGPISKSDILKILTWQSQNQEK